MIPLNTDKYSIRAILYTRHFDFKNVITPKNNVSIGDIGHALYYAVTCREDLTKNCQYRYVNYYCSAKVIRCWNTDDYGIALTNIGQAFHIGKCWIIGKGFYNREYVKIGDNVINIEVSNKCLKLFKTSGDCQIYEID